MSQGSLASAAAPVNHRISKQRLQARGGGQRSQQNFDAAAAAALVAFAEQLARALQRGGTVEQGSSTVSRLESNHPAANCNSNKGSRDAVTLRPCQIPMPYRSDHLS